MARLTARDPVGDYSVPALGWHPQPGHGKARKIPSRARGRPPSSRPVLRVLHVVEVKATDARWTVHKICTDLEVPAVMRAWRLAFPSLPVRAVAYLPQASVAGMIQKARERVRKRPPPVRVPRPPELARPGYMRARPVPGCIPNS